MQEGIGMKYIYFVILCYSYQCLGFYFMLDVDKKRSKCEIIEVIVWYYSPTKTLKNNTLVISINEVLGNK